MTTTTYRRKSIVGHTIPEVYGREAGKEARMEVESSHLNHMHKAERVS